MSLKLNKNSYLIALFLTAITAIASAGNKPQDKPTLYVAVGEPNHQMLKADEVNRPQTDGLKIVIATHGMTGWRHVMFGSVAEKVVRLAHRPVLTVPAPRE